MDKDTVSGNNSAVGNGPLGQCQQQIGQNDHGSNQYRRRQNGEVTADQRCVLQSIQFANSIEFQWKSSLEFDRISKVDVKWDTPEDNVYLHSVMLPGGWYK